MVPFGLQSTATGGAGLCNETSLSKEIRDWVEAEIIQVVSNWRREELDAGAIGACSARAGRIDP